MSEIEKGSLMGRPVQLIEILAEQTIPENMRCEACHGLGEIQFPDREAGFDYEACEACCETGLNQLGFILQGILRPPPEGYGPVVLKEALRRYLEEQSQNPNVRLKNAEALLEDCLRSLKTYQQVSQPIL